MKNLTCPNCKSGCNLVLKVDFKAKLAIEAICVKIWHKPSMVRKFHQIKKNGCNTTFKITLKGAKRLQDQLVKGSLGVGVG
jgi:hypothetical protein